MRFSVHQISEGEDELILKYRQMNSEVEEILAFMERHEKKLVGKIDGETIIFQPEEILYIEKVDEKTFAYTSEHVIQMDVSLSMAELILDDERFFRCSKSMIINVNRVERLKSLPSNRIDATMQGGEHIIISRTYASDFRKLLRGE
ncbi:MAG: LytTR family DNA-binding domain-containing protein [Acetatifactor sp.]